MGRIQFTQPIVCVPDLTHHDNSMHGTDPPLWHSACAVYQILDPNPGSVHMYLILTPHLLYLYYLILNPLLSACVLISTPN